MKKRRGPRQRTKAHHPFRHRQLWKWTPHKKTRKADQNRRKNRLLQGTQTKREEVSKAVGCDGEVGLGKEPRVIEGDCVCGLAAFVCRTWSRFTADKPLNQSKCCSVITHYAIITLYLELLGQSILQGCKWHSLLLSKKQMIGIQFSGAQTLECRELITFEGEKWITETLDASQSSSHCAQSRNISPSAGNE